MAVQDGDFIFKYKLDAKVLYLTEKRIEMIESLKIVDEVVKYESISPAFFSEIYFDNLALGEDQIA